MRYLISLKDDVYEALDILTGKTIKFSIYFQSIVCPVTRLEYAYELLTRFKDPDIDVECFFEHVDHDFKKMLLKTQANKINEICLSNRSLFTINCCSSVLSDYQFIKSVFSKLKKKVAVELTSMPKNKIESDRILKSMTELKTLGHQIWLDDYLSKAVPIHSLEYFNWDIVKIDKEFINKNINNQEEISRVISESSSFGRRRFVVEGIETSEQHKILLKYKGLCQGFYYGKPMRVGELLSVSA